MTEQVEQSKKKESMNVDETTEKEEKKNNIDGSKPKNDKALNRSDRMDVDDDKDDEKTDDPLPTSKIREDVNIIIGETNSTNNLADGIEKLLLLEKKQRQAEHEANTLHIAKEIINLCYKHKDWNLLIEQIVVVCKRRSQFRRVVKRIVEQSMEWIDDLIKNTELQLKLIDSLISVTEGKIFVEVQRARLTKKLAFIYETVENNVVKAADTLQELQIETFGSMKKEEKCQFLLEQMRLCMRKKDFVRAGIVRNKITPKTLANLTSLQKRYWDLSLIFFYHHESQYLNLSKAYRKLKDLVNSNKDKKDSLSMSIFALVLAKHSNERNDLLFKILKEEKKLLESLPIFKELLILLTTMELIKWPLNNNISDKLLNFKFYGIAVKDKEQMYESLLHERIIQHNIIVCHKYYSRITSKRLSQFLGISYNDSEEYLSKMVTNGHIYARIDRLSGIIRFRRKQTPNNILNDWRSNIDKLLNLVDETCHQIHKEMVIHESKSKSKSKSKKSKKNKN